MPWQICQDGYANDGKAMTEETGGHQPAPPPAEEPEPEAGGDRVPATGDTRVDEALASLTELGEAPDADHVEAFERVHRQLSEILGEVGGQGNPDRTRGPGGR